MRRLDPRPALARLWQGLRRGAVRSPKPPKPPKPPRFPRLNAFLGRVGRGVARPFRVLGTGVARLARWFFAALLAGLTRLGNATIAFVGAALPAALGGALLAGAVETGFGLVLGDSIHGVRTVLALVAAGLGLWLLAVPGLMGVALVGTMFARLRGPRTLLDALGDRERQPAALSVVLLVLGALTVQWLAPDPLNSFLLPLFKDPDLLPSALRGGLIGLGLASIVLGLLVHGSLTAVLRRIPGRFGVRLVLMLGGVATALVFLLRGTWQSLAKDVPLLAVVLPVGAIAAMGLTHLVLRSRRLPRLVVGGGLGGLAALSVAGYFAFDAMAGVRLALSDANGLIPVITGEAAKLYDLDADGFSPLFGGNDCDDDDPDVNPGAADLPGDGIDQDCSGSDRLAFVPAERVPMTYVDRPGNLARSWNVLLITVDALRPDHLETYGYGRETAPVLDGLAQKSVVFDRAYTSAGSTAFAVPSLLSGRSLADLDIEWAGHYFVTEPGQHLLFERLKAAGYATEAHMAAQLHNGMWLGLDTGIDRYVGHPDVRLMGPSAPALTEATLDALDRLAPAAPGPAPKPFALWIHYHEPHEPYTFHPDLPGLGTTDFGHEDVDRYDGEIAYFDQHFAKVLEKLEKTGLSKNTIIVVTSDHGEELKDHGRRFHGKQQFEESIRIPLIIHVPGLAPRRSSTAASLMDVPETIANLVGLAPPPDRGAQSLMGQMLGTTPDDPSRPLMVETILDQNQPRGRLVSRIEWPDKLIVDLRSGATRFFNLEADPHERENLADEGGAHFEAMETALGAYVDRADAEIFDRLRRKRVSRHAPPGTGHAPETVAPGLQWMGSTLRPFPRISPRAFELRQWFRASGASRGDYRVRVAWYDKQGLRLDQRDYVPLAGHYPTSAWGNGEVVEDLLYVLLKKGRGTAEARLSILQGNTGSKVVWGPRVIDTVTLPPAF